MWPKGSTLTRQLGIDQGTCTCMEFYFLMKMYTVVPIIAVIYVKCQFVGESVGAHSV